MTPATRDAGSTEPWRYLVLNVTVTLACDNTQRVQQLTNMPRTQQQQQSSGGRHSGRQGAGRGRSAHGQQATQRTMCGSEWARVNGRVNLMPDVLSQGLPPQPWDRLPDSSASYVDRWKKLCFLEFHASLFEFCAELQAPQGRRPQRPRLSVTLERSGPLEQTGRKPPLGCWVVTIESRGDGADAEVSVSDLPHALIHLEGEGWFYVQNLEQQDLPGRFPVRADGYLYSDGFQRAPGAHGSSWSCAQIFESFLTFRYRFKALSTYMGVGADVRRALEQPGPLPAAAALQLVPLQQGQVSKLNAGQRAILQRLRWPVDFVQGPPGTGKSTLIVELLKLRVPPSARVLLCTTTNRAIDSLAEKLAASGFGDSLLAFGNPSRLGATSARFLLDNRTTAHPAIAAMAALLAALARCNRGLRAAGMQLQRLRDATPDTAAVKPRCTFSFGGLLRALGLGLPAGPARVSSGERASEASELEQKLMAQQVKLLRIACSALSTLLLHVPSVAVAGTTLLLSAASVSMERASAVLASQLAAIPALRDAALAVQVAESKLMLAAGLVRASVALHILATVRYVVCTATTAVRLPDCIQRSRFNVRAAARLPAPGSKNRHDDAQDPPILFEYVVLDEAGAMLEPDLVGTIIHGCKFLLAVGDHLQLPPFTAWRDASRYQYSVSMLERHAEHLPPSHNLMTEQYRMAPHISELVSALSYRGALTTAAVTAAARQRSPAMTFVDVRGEELRVRTSYSNQAEVEAVLRLVRTERAARPTQLINVIAFHKPQMYALRDALKREGLLTDNRKASLDDPATLDVVTVDSMQGREADIIIVSCTRTTPDIGFLRDLRRLNVAISRAKEMLYVVGHKAALLNCDCVSWHKVVGHCK